MAFFARCCGQHFYLAAAHGAYQDLCFVEFAAVDQLAKIGIIAPCILEFYLGFTRFSTDNCWSANCAPA
ncbi:MAG: hypothetical protein IPL65_12885 [Lewinellaceae bacterium]|nr:hypothetical protein [Lewinellaceae bacterium]